MCEKCMVGKQIEQEKEQSDELTRLAEVGNLVIQVNFYSYTKYCAKECDDSRMYVCMHI